MKIATTLSEVRERAQHPAPPAVVDPGTRALILRIASALTPYADRRSAEAVKATAGPLLAWAGRAADREDLRNRVRAMEQQDANTPHVTRKLRIPGEPVQFVNEPTVTSGEFLAETESLYAFY